MRAFLKWSTAATAALLLSLGAGCVGAEPSPAQASSTGAAKVAPTGSPSAAPPTMAPPALPQGDEPVDLDPAQFTTEIDNPYWPMAPGTQWTYRETDGQGGEQKVVVTVTNETKQIANGVTARVVRDTVTENGDLVEDTLDWYAQDAQGNVWYMGEDTAEFSNGEISSRGGSFEAGVDDALPGIIIPANPAPGMRYRQEYYKGEAEDNGEVLSTDELAETPYGQFRGALLTKDTITIEPDVQEYKVYAKGVGPVLVLGVSGGGGREELLSVEQVSGDSGTGPLGSPKP